MCFKTWFIVSPCNSVIRDVIFCCACTNILLIFSGTESETKEFMQVCVQTVNKYPGDDYRSPVFIFERLCSIIFPVSMNPKKLFQ